MAPSLKISLREGGLSTRSVAVRDANGCDEAVFVRSRSKGGRLAVDGLKPPPYVDEAHSHAARPLLRHLIDPGVGRNAVRDADAELPAPNLGLDVDLHRIARRGHPML